MFFINVKEVFQQHILEILLVLSIVYFGALTFSVVIKWIQPRLQKYAAMYEDEVLEDSLDGVEKVSWKRWKKKNCRKLVCNIESSDSDSTNEDNLNVIERVKSTADLSDPLSKYSKRNPSKNELIEELALGIENAIILRTLLMDTLKSKKYSSEVQTNITISPKVKVDYFCPTFLLPQSSSQIRLEETKSSENFESAESGDDEEYMPIFRQLGCCDILKRNKLDSDGNFEHVAQKNRNSKFGVFLNPENADTTLKSLKEDSGPENKMLQLALREFEKELKPIRDQIKELKDCLADSEDDFRGISLNLFSDTSSSFTEITKQSEMLSEPSTTSSSNLHYNIVSSFLEHHPSKGLKSNFKSQCFIKNMKSPSLPLSIKIKNLSPSQTIYISDEKDYTKQPSRHSPLAEMYIKLSHCNSRDLRRQSDKTNVTCHINLNVDLESSSVTSLVNPTSKKDRYIISPFLSEPEDIFREQPGTSTRAKNSDFLIIQ